MTSEPRPRNPPLRAGRTANVVRRVAKAADRRIGGLAVVGIGGCVHRRSRLWTTIGALRGGDDGEDDRDRAGDQRGEDRCSHPPDEEMAPAHPAAARRSVGHLDLAAARRARAFGEVVLRVARRARLLSGFERLALFRVDLRDGRVRAESSSAAPALRPVFFERFRAAVDVPPALRSVALTPGFDVSTGSSRRALGGLLAFFGPERCFLLRNTCAFVAIEDLRREPNAFFSDALTLNQQAPKKRQLSVGAC